MKRILLFVLVLALLAGALPATSFAEEIMYAPVDVILEKQNAKLEAEYREWAASVIYEYYNDYCYYNNDNMDLYNTKLPEYEKGKKEFNPKGIEFRGINREYYMASEFKEYFDFIVKTDYSTHLSDKEVSDAAKVEEANNQKKLTYMNIIADTLVSKAELTPEVFQNLDISNYTGYYKFSAETGTFSYDKTMTAISLQNMAEIENALTDILTSTVDLFADVACKRMKSSNLKGPAEYAQKIFSTTLTAIDESLDVQLKNDKAKLDNQIQEYMQAEIANSMLKANDQMIEYMRLVYNRELDFGFNDRLDDAVFMEAVEGVIEIAEQMRAANISVARSDAKEAVDTYFESHSVAKDVLDDKELTVVVLENTFSLMLDLLLEKIVGEMGEESGEQKHSVKSKVAECLIFAVAAAMEEMIDEIAERHKDDTNIQNIISDVGKTIVDGKFWGRVASKAGQYLVDYFGKGSKIDAHELGYKTIGELVKTIENLFENPNLDSWQEWGKESIKIFWNILGACADNFSWPEQIRSSAENAENWKGLLEKFGANMLEVVELVDLSKMMNVSEALATAIYAARNEETGEDQDSYNAYQMYYAYSSSVRLMMDLHMEILSLAEDTKSAFWDSSHRRVWIDALQSEAVSLEKLKLIVGAIRLQIGQDIAGQEYLINILSEAAKKDEKNHSKFYKYLQDAMDTSVIWKDRISLEKAGNACSLMTHYYNAYENGDKAAYKVLFS